MEVNDVKDVNERFQHLPDPRFTDGGYDNMEFYELSDDEQEKLMDAYYNSILHQSLEVVNELRYVMGIGEGKLAKLPQGRKGNPQFCVLARSLSNGWIPDVGQSEIALKHSPDDTVIDWTKMLETLTSLGYDAYFSREYDQEGEDYHIVGIDIKTPSVCYRFIQYFDCGSNELFNELAVDDDEHLPPLEIVPS